MPKCLNENTVKMDEKMDLYLNENRKPIPFVPGHEL